MARIEAKSTKAKNILNKVLLWCAVGFLAAVLIASIVIVVLWIVGNNEDDDKEFVEIYETAETITFDDLALMLDNDEHSELIDKHGTIYVYIYSPEEHNADDDTDTTAERLHAKVTECVDAYNAIKDTNSSVAFYIINTTHEDNESSSLLSTYSTTTLLVFGEETKTSTSYKDILAGLRAACNELVAE